ncbi:MAG TPA: FHA domain-containing protein [Aggregatilineales bacterium]|nr:FHA domain-containing protein [Anaerolineales bacterium]HRE48554.1 FHA domain-containing protein [Aggregatilineales bacterium]
MPEGLAKISWDDPQTQEKREFVLVEGATASIGRAPENDISIPERHVSRQHAVVAFRDGVFTITDLGSANGTFVNDQRLSAPFPLAHGDQIRLYVPQMSFSAIVTEEEQEFARKTGTIIVPAIGTGRPKLIATNGPHEGSEFTLAEDIITIGRSTVDAAWDISLSDRAVSRPHCRLTKKGEMWVLMDLGSANGTVLNGNTVGAQPIPLKDGDVVKVGESTLMFRLAK